MLAEHGCSKLGGYPSDRGSRLVVEDNKRRGQRISNNAAAHQSAQASNVAISPETLVVIPAWDEVNDIGEVVRRVKAQGLDVLVVDDHSTDNTAEVAADAGARVIRLAIHVGAWAAMQTGIRVALRDGYQYTLTLDGDGQHHPEDIPLLMAGYTQSETPVNVVIGACVARGNLRRRMAWRLLRVLSGVQVNDMTSGFRLYDFAAMTVLGSAECSLLEYQDVGVMLHLHRRGLKAREVEVEMGPRQTGHSRIFNTWRMVGRYLIYSLLLTLTRRQYGRSSVNTGAAT